MDKTQTTPDEFIASLPADQRLDIEQLDALLSDLLPDQPKTMWEGRLWGGTDQRIIGYGEYSYRRSDGQMVHWFMVGLTAQKNYISVYVNATDNDGYVAKRWADRLGNVKVGASSISFKAVDDVQLSAFSDMITEARALMD